MHEPGHERDSIVVHNLRSWVMIWNFASKKSSAVLHKEACISLLWQSADARRLLLAKQCKESSSISSLCSLRMFLGGETMRTTTFAPFAFLLSLRRVEYQTFLKAGRQNCKNVFRPKKINGSLFCSSLSE